MRKMAFILANFFMKVFNKNHSDRYVYYYYLQMIVAQVVALTLIILVGIKYGIWGNYLVILPSFYILKKLLKVDYHATSFNSCVAMTTIMIISLGFMAKWSMYSAIIVLTSMLFLMTYDSIKISLDLISTRIDNLIKYGIRIGRRKRGH